MSDTFHTVFFAMAVTLIAGPLWVAWRRTEPRLAPIVAAAVVAGLRWHTARLGETARRTLGTLGDFFHREPWTYATDDEVLHAWDETAEPTTDGGWPVPGSQERCTCGARRCANKRAGVHCPAQRAPSMLARFFTDGAHTPHMATARAVEPGWSPLRTEVRVFLAPTFWQRRLPVLAGAA